MPFNYDPEKRRAYMRDRYHKQAKKIMEQNAKSRKKRVDWYKEYRKTLRCERCGFDDWRALHFHHLGGKEFGVAKMAHQGHSIERIMAEIAKCQVLCANCHLIVHAEERGEFR